MRKLFSLVAAAVLAACGGSSTQSTVRLALAGLSPLGTGFAYEGWLIVGGQPQSTGRFNADLTGALVTVSGAAIAQGDFAAGASVAASTATAFVITIEKTGVAGPSATHYLAGAVTNSQATLSTAAPQALGSDFTAAAGKYILAAPTDSAPAHNLSGLWFIDLSSGSPAAGLSLPALPAGWKYEGWAVINGQPVSTGKFVSASGPDLAAPYSGSGSAPSFPGEDFLHNAPAGLAFPTNLQGGMAVITIEPDPDDSPAPFALKPLIGSIGAAAADHVTYPMANKASTFPSGTATIR